MPVQTLCIGSGGGLSQGWKFMVPHGMLQTHTSSRFAVYHFCTTMRAHPEPECALRLPWRCQIRHLNTLHPAVTAHTRRILLLLLLRTIPCKVIAKSGLED